MSGLRIRFHAEALTAARARTEVPQTRFMLGAMGARRSLAKRDELQSAQIEFFVSYLTKLRGQSPPEPESLATLSGNVTLKGSPATPVFETEADVELAHRRAPEKAPAGSKDPRKAQPILLELSFDPGQFPALGRQQLKVPRAEGDAARFLEIRAELTIAGAVEASRNVNDVWDVPYAPLERKLEWLLEAPEGASEAQLIVKDEAEQVAFSRRLELSSPSGQQLFDLSRLPVANGYTLELQAGGITLAPLLTLHIEDFETSLLLEDIAGVAKSLTPNASASLPEALSGSEQHPPDTGEPDLMPEPDITP